MDCLALEDGQWENGPELAVAAKFPIVAQIKSIVYLLDCSNTRLLLKFDPENNTWIRQASPPYGDYSVASMTTANDQLCVVSGRWCHCAWYNPATNAWCKVQQPLKDHYWGSLVHHGNKIIHLGGRTNDVEELSIETGTWSVSSIKLPVKLQNHRALVLDIPHE